MSQVPTPEVPSGSGLSVRQAINAVMAALMSNNSGPSEPPNPVPFQLWGDSANNDLKIRNASNTGWVLVSEFLGALEYDRPQTLAATARLQAATNIGALVYDQGQSLTDPQQTQARANIGAGEPAFMGVVSNFIISAGVVMTNPSSSRPLFVDMMTTPASTGFIEIHTRQNNSTPWLLIGRGWSGSHAGATGIVPAGWQYKMEQTATAEARTLY